MKLNNKGWDTQEMIALSSIILVALVVAVILVNGMVKEASFINPTPNNIDVEEPKKEEYNYDELEDKIKLATARYITENYTEPFEDTLYVSSDALEISGYLNDFIDLEDGSSCDGYVVVFFDDENEINYNPYINCTNYKTFGYVEER